MFTDLVRFFLRENGSSREIVSQDSNRGGLDCHVQSNIYHPGGLITEEYIFSISEKIVRDIFKLDPKFKTLYRVIQKLRPP